MTYEHKNNDLLARKLTPRTVNINSKYITTNNCKLITRYCIMLYRHGGR